jgi:hypothetical protein
MDTKKYGTVLYLVLSVICSFISRSVLFPHGVVVSSSLCVLCVCVCRSFSDVSLTHSRLTPHVSRPPTSNTSFLSFFVLCSRILDKVERLCLYGFMLYCMYVLYLYVIMVVYTVVCTVLMYCM